MENDCYICRNGCASSTATIQDASPSMSTARFLVWSRRRCESLLSPSLLFSPSATYHPCSTSFFFLLFLLCRLAKRGKKLNPIGLPSDVHVLSSDMSLSLQMRIVELVRDGIASSKLRRDSAKIIKNSLDRHLNKLWHVVIVEGQYWSYYSHEPGFSFVFRIGREVFIIFRTPFL